MLNQPESFLKMYSRCSEQLIVGLEFKISFDPGGKKRSVPLVIIVAHVIDRIIKVKFCYIYCITIPNQNYVSIIFCWNIRSL